MVRLRIAIVSRILTGVKRLSIAFESREWYCLISPPAARNSFKERTPPGMPRPMKRWQSESIGILARRR